jgi:transketolase
VWEGTLFALQYNLDNLMYIIDYNRFQLDGMINNILNLEPLQDKFRSFGFDVKSIDRHNLEELKKALDFSLRNKKPKAVICKTVSIMVLT